jgi:hypothetical protein
MLRFATNPRDITHITWNWETGYRLVIWALSPSILKMVNTVTGLFVGASVDHDLDNGGYYGNIKVETSLGGVPVSAEIDSLTIDWIA